MKKPLSLTVQVLLLIGAFIIGVCGLAGVAFGGYQWYTSPAQSDIRAQVGDFFTFNSNDSDEAPIGVYTDPTVADTHPSVQPYTHITADNYSLDGNDSTSASSDVVKSNNWEITYHEGADLNRGDGTTFRNTFDEWNFKKIAPELWATFPNVPNPLVPEFRVVNGDQVPDGVEYAMDESNFCQQLGGEGCRVPVAAMHYLLFTGDYDIPEIGACEAKDGFGCELIIVNVGNVTADLTGVFSQGFRLHARYWNGDALDMAMWGLSSHAANNMLNMDSKLNPDGIQNAGANCSVPNACEGVDVRIVFISGNELLVTMETTVQR